MLGVSGYLKELAYGEAGGLWSEAPLPAEGVSPRCAGDCSMWSNSGSLTSWKTWIVAWARFLKNICDMTFSNFTTAWAFFVAACARLIVSCFSAARSRVPDSFRSAYLFSSSLRRICTESSIARSFLPSSALTSARFSLAAPPKTLFVRSPRHQRWMRTMLPRIPAW